MPGHVTANRSETSQNNEVSSEWVYSPLGVPGSFDRLFSIPLLDIDSGALLAEANFRLALSSPEQLQGLMFTEEMPENDGMLFPTGRPAQQALWMKETYIPLDAGWFTQDGVLREVQALIPGDLTWRSTNRDDISFALEMNSGWFAKRGLKPEQVRVDLHALRAAIQERGFDPAEYFPTGGFPGTFDRQYSIPLLDMDSGMPLAQASVHLAVTNPELLGGLRNFREFPQDDGMLFVSTTPTRHTMGMNDTYIPLDAGSFTLDGVLREVQSLTPKDPTWHFSERDDISFGLEMNFGWFMKRGLQPGHVRLDLKAVHSALRYRGFAPEEYFQRAESSAPKSQASRPFLSLHHSDI